MPKRKNSRPVKFLQTFPSSFVSLREDVSLSCDDSVKIKKVCFNNGENDSFEKNEISVKFKGKKILHKCPSSCVILGEISFVIENFDSNFIKLSDANFSILMNKVSKPILKISVGSEKNISFFNLTLPDELLSSIANLLQHQFIWVIKSFDDFSKGVLTVLISVTPEKTPILKAEKIVELFFHIDVKGLKENSLDVKECTKDFFKEIKNYQKFDFQLNKINVQHEKLIPKLCPYQARAVQWMIFREDKELKFQETNWLPSVIETLKSKCKKNLYYNKYSGVLSLSLFDFPLLPRGGILADEMGLGKTVAVISLILNHRRSKEDELDNSEFLSSYAVRNLQDMQKLKLTSEFSSDNDSIKKNKEDCLDANEKLIYNKVSKGPALKRALTEWYESKLAEYSTSTNKTRKITGDSTKCICGNVDLKKKDLCVQCPACKRFQHSKCVGYNETFTYFCPSCWTKQKLVKSGGTLIIAPASIYHQWVEEIKKHVSPEGLKNGVFMYNGVKDGFIQPSVLSVYDVTITTYAILRAEVNHAISTESSRKLRNEERFLKMCSPLSQIHWWRLCLDEAQMVENDYSNINQMANLIPSVNRWSVTGTPIQKSISDLYYLTEWLRIKPFSDKVIWENFLFLPYLNGNKVPLCSVISKIFWRNSKEDVAEELIIPKQTVKYHLLKFTAIEQNFYMREHAISSAKFSENLGRLHLDVNQTIDSLDKKTLTKLLIPLLNLRQACSHPLAVKGNKISSKTGNMTLTELLQYLFNKTKLECEEGMRKFISALNGLAGIFCIEEDWFKAVEYYRQVLQFSEEYKEKFHIDSLQLIHTMTNLREILQHHSEGVPPTLRDDSLEKDAKALENKYLQKSIDDLRSNENLLNELSEKISELTKKFETSSDVWWCRLIHLLTIDGSIGELMDKVSAELITSEVENKKNLEFFIAKISTIKGFEIMLKNWIANIENNRDKSLENLATLKKIPCDELVYSAVDCHLRTSYSETKKKKCQLCSCESVFLDYECILFDVSRKTLKAEYEKILDGAQTKGSWRPHKAEKCMKVLLNVSKSKPCSELWCLKDGRTHLQVLEAMKKEFKQLRAVWMSINHRVQAYDELSMCKLRLRLRLPGEYVPPKMTNLSLNEQNKIESIYIIEHYELESQKLKLESERKLSESEFKKKFGTLLYLKNLGQKENPKPDPCPVCKSVLDNEWCVLQCGHSYCIDCIRIMLTRSSKPSLSCPVCREITKAGDISFIDLSGKQEYSNFKVIGDHSTKVDGIIRSLLELREKNPKVKVLIFSTWVVVLKILEVGLNQNGITFRRMPGHNYQVHLKQFRDPNLNITALLLPISWGSKGLNLIEASHVFLVEPIMNPAEELQAIGRIHRIGQTQETVVHRFLISGTIEEKIHSAVSEARDKWGQKKITIEDLKNLFDMKNEFVMSANSS